MRKSCRSDWVRRNLSGESQPAQTDQDSITAGQCGTAEDGSQRRAILRSLTTAARSRCVITGWPGRHPAAHGQTETAMAIAGEPGRGYVVTVKGNQPSLRRAVFDAVLPLLCRAPHDVVEEHARGRIKKWSCWVTGAEGIDFPHARLAAFIRREVFEISGDRISKENALVLTGGKPGEMTAADVSRHVRKHWGIENKSHYATSFTGKITTRPGPATARKHSLRSATSQ
jgi:hypothetical protein